MSSVGGAHVRVGPYNLLGDYRNQGFGDRLRMTGRHSIPSSFRTRNTGGAGAARATRYATRTLPFQKFLNVDWARWWSLRRSLIDHIRRHRDRLLITTRPPASLRAARPRNRPCSGLHAAAPPAHRS